MKGNLIYLKIFLYVGPILTFGFIVVGGIAILSSPKIHILLGSLIQVISISLGGFSGVAVAKEIKHLIKEDEERNF